jgi:type I restriction enzyme S subunit
MNELKPYPEYKESPLGPIPAHWKSAEIKRLAEVTLGKMLQPSAASSTDVESPYLYAGMIQDAGIRENEDLIRSMWASPSELAVLGLRADDVLVVEGGSVGRSVHLAVARPGWIFQNSVNRLRPISGLSIGAFLDYLMSMLVASGAVEAACNKATIMHLTAEKLSRLGVPMPTFIEQVQIAKFLDRETAEIDAFIADQEELIGLLAERRAATISHAVTKGLDPTVAMKDSGVDWLGEIPETWDIRRIKQFVSVPVTDGPHETPEMHDEGIPFVSAEAVGSGMLNMEKIRGFITAEDNAKYSQKYSPKFDDIYMVKSGATTGVVAIVDIDTPFNIWSPLAAIRCGDGAHARFVMYALKSFQFQESVRLHWNFGTQQNIGMSVIENLPIAFPPGDQQLSIAVRLDRETAELDATIADAKEAIVLSQERRAALISAAVTGKIDVREHGAVA